MVIPSDWKTLDIISILDTDYIYWCFILIYFIYDSFSLYQSLILIFIYLYIYLNFIWKWMCLMLSMINCSRKCLNVKKKRKEKKKAVVVRNVYLFSFLRLFLPSIFPLFFPSVKAEVFIAYFQSGVFIVQIPASFNSSTLAKKCCYCFPKVQTGFYCLLGPLCKRL